MNRLQLAIYFLSNKMLAEYEVILKAAKQTGYNIISLRDSLDPYYNDKKCLILRHDVDHCTRGTLQMHLIETQYNATSSFYFRKCTWDNALINKIEKYGSEASFHFETIADYIKLHKLKSKKQLQTLPYLQDCKSWLKADLETLRKKHKLPLVTIAAHGEKENNLFKITNNVLTENDNDYPYFNIKLEAYDKVFIDSITTYISDCTKEINNGYRYGITPLEAIQNNSKRILFLTHPNYWHYPINYRLKKAIKVLIFGATNKPETFNRILSY